MIMDKLRLPGILSKIAKWLTFSTLLLSGSLVLGQGSPPGDSIKLLVIDFEGTPEYDEYVRKQLGQMLAKELNQFVLPVLSMEDRDRRVDLLSDYQGDVSVEERLDERYPRPDYWCKGIISSAFISASIIDFETEAQIATAKLKTKKNLEKQIKRLAEELTKILIKQRFNIELDQLSLMGVRSPNNATYKWQKPIREQRDNTHWFNTSKTTRAMTINLETADGESIQLGPYPGIKPQSLQLWRIKKGPLDRRSIVPLRNRFSISGHYFAYRERSSAVLSAQYLYLLSGKFGLGVGVNYYRIPVTTLVRPIPLFEANPIYSEEYLISPALVGQYQHYSSRANLFYGLQLEAYPIEAGGSATAFIGLPKLHWLRLEFAVRSFSTDVPACSFRPMDFTAQRTSVTERFLLLSAGLQISTSF